MNLLAIWNKEKTLLLEFDTLLKHHDAPKMCVRLFAGKLVCLFVDCTCMMWFYPF